MFVYERHTHTCTHTVELQTVEITVFANRGIATKKRKMLKQRKGTRGLELEKDRTELRKHPHEAWEYIVPLEVLGSADDELLNFVLLT